MIEGRSTATEPPLTSHLARRAVEEACIAAGLAARRDAAQLAADWPDEEYLDCGLTPQVFEERMRLRARLRASGLAQLLPGGWDSLPDILEPLPPPLRSLLRLFRPRSYGQLVRFMAGHLEWYLEPAEGWLRWRRLAEALAVPAAVTMGALLAVLVVCGAEVFKGWGILLCAPAPVVVLGMAVYGGTQSQARRLAALEFYLYLREAYRDAPDD
jgi:hypothetical protein